MTGAGQRIPGGIAAAVTVPAVEVLPNDRVLLTAPGMTEPRPLWHTVARVGEATLRGAPTAGEEPEIPAVRLISAAGRVWVFRADRPLRVQRWAAR